MPKDVSLWNGTAVVVPVLASASLDKDLQSQRLASATTQPSSVSTFFRPEGKSVSASFTFILMMESNIRMWDSVYDFIISPIYYDLHMPLPTLFRHEGKSVSV